MSQRWIGLGLVTAVVATLALPAVSQEQQPRRGNRSVTGRITAAAESGLDLEIRGRQGATSALKVTVDGATKVQELKPAALADLKVNQLVLVAGEAAEGGKLTANRIVLGNVVDGQPSMADLAVLRSLGNAGARRRPAANPAPAPGQGRGNGPAVGKVVKTSPLTIERIARGNAAPMNVEVATPDAARFYRLDTLTFKDLKVGDTVSVAAAGPRQEGQTEIKAVAVTRVPARRPANANN